MTLTATNLETSISTRMTVESKEDGPLAIPAKILLETLKALPNQQVTFDVDLEQRSLVLTTETGMYKMAVDPPDDFPALPASDDKEIHDSGGPAYSAGSITPFSLPLQMKCVPP